MKNTLRHILTLTMALLITGPAQSQDYPDPDIRLMIESPQSLTTNANIGSIRGWATHPTEQVIYVEIYLDGEYSFSVPVGGGRKDVEDAYPDYYNSRFSGWNQTVNYKNMTEGFHEAEIVAYTEFGGYKSKFVSFCVTRFDKEFISDPEEIKLWMTERFHLWHDRMVLEGVEVEGKRWNMELSWSTATQSFEITQTTVYEYIDEYTTYECTPED